VTQVGPRALVVTDSDSYVKWGAALAGQLPVGWPVRLLVTHGNALPSDRQLVEALEHTRFNLDDVEVVDRPTLVRVLREWEPDLVVLAARGLTAETVARLLPGGSRRPLVVSGLAGISIPVLIPGLRMRRAADVFVVHSHRELRDFPPAAEAAGLTHRFELGTLPFLASAPRPWIPQPGPRHGAPTPELDRIVFAAQAMVPASRTDRLRLLRRLVETASAHPELSVVIKVRALDGEPQTHVEQFSYQQLLDDLVQAGEPLPANLTVESGPMAWHLRRAVGLATVSSTALLEAVAAGVPCLALDDFGVGRQQINLVFVGSGLLASTDELVRGAFRMAAPEWLEDNYLHDVADNTWIGAVEELLARRASIGLPPLELGRRGPSRIVRAGVFRRLAFVPSTRRRPGALHRAFLAAGFWEHRRRWAVRPGAPDAQEGRPASAVAPTTGSRS